MTSDRDLTQTDLRKRIDSRNWKGQEQSLASAIAGSESLNDASRNLSPTLGSIFYSVKCILREGTHMVAPNRPDLYPPMFNFSRKEPVSLLAKMYSDLQVPIPALSLWLERCSVLIGWARLPCPPSRQGKDLPLNPTELRGGRLLKENQDAVTKEGERIQNRCLRLDNCISPVPLLAWGEPEIQQEERGLGLLDGRAETRSQGVRLLLSSLSFCLLSLHSSFCLYS